MARYFLKAVYDMEIHYLHILSVDRGASQVSHSFSVDGNLFYEAMTNSCHTIQHILNTYGCASSQQCNFAKLALSFSPNTDPQVISLFQKTLGMTVVDCHEKYLGLPYFVGKDKKALFRDTKDKVWKFLCSWQEKLFSKGGKEVPLKAMYKQSLFMAMYKIYAGQK